MLAITSANCSKLHAIARDAEPTLGGGAHPMNTLLVGPHFLIREALRGILKELKQDFAIQETADGEQAVRLLSGEANFALVILDLDLPGGRGLGALRELRSRYPATPLVVVSSAHDGNTIARTLHLGVRGFILKSAERKIMLSALELIFAGGIYIPREILALENSSVPKTAAAVPRDAAAVPTPKPAAAVLRKPAGYGLTDRQLDVLAAMLQGKTNKAICRDLNLAEPTVKNHVTAIFKELGVRNRVEAVLAAGALGLAGASVNRGSATQGTDQPKLVGLPRPVSGRA